MLKIRKEFFVLLLIYKKNVGIGGLYRGFVAASTIGVSMTLGEFFGSSIAITPLARLFLRASLTTAVFPFQMTQIRMITHPEKYQSTLQTLQKIYTEEELPALFRGLGMTLVGLLMRDFLTGFVSSAWLKLSGKGESKDVLDLFITGATISLLVELIQYPICTALRIIQSHPHNTDNVNRVLFNTAKISRASGIFSLFRGFGASLVMLFGLPLQWLLQDFIISNLFQKNVTLPKRFF